MTPIFSRGEKRGVHPALSRRAIDARVGPFHWFTLWSLTLAWPLAIPAELAITNADYVLRLNEAGRVAILEIPPVEFDFWASNDVSGVEARLMCRRLYQHFQDHFDFILFLSDQDIVPPNNYFGIYFGAKNEVTGIGYPLYTNSAAFGSAGRLQSVIHLKHLFGLRRGPSLHEICHRWANGLSDLFHDGSHWGFSSVGGQLGGWQYGTLTHLGGNLYHADGPRRDGSGFSTFANGGNGVPYSELELYLMGLIAPEEVVNPIQKAIGAGLSATGPGHFTATRIETLALTDVIDSEGPRLPSHLNSPKVFRALAAVIAKAPLSAARVSAYDQDVRNFSLNGSDGSAFYNFWEATGGRATMQMDGLLQSLRPAILELEAAVFSDVQGGNGNFAAEPGEIIVETISLQNITGMTASNVTATLAAITPGVTILRANAAYPDIPAGFARNGHTAFIYQIAPTMPCGTSIQLQLVAASGSQRFTNRFSRAAGRLVSTGRTLTNSFESAASPQAILSEETIFSTNSIGVPGSIGDVNVALRLNHTFDEDLAIALQHPDGTEVVLARNRGGPLDNYGTGHCAETGGRTIFDDEAGTPIGSGSAPFMGRFVPEEPLSAFDGKPLSGVWRLRVTDQFPQDSGALLCWSVDMTYAELSYECSIYQDAPSLYLSRVMRAPGGHFSFSWTAIGGVRYRVEFGEEISPTGRIIFRPLSRSTAEETAPGPAGASAIMSFTDDFTLTGGPPSSGQRYFRVVVVP